MSKTLKIHITGEATIYRNDKWGYPVYSAKLSTQKDGQWLYDYIQVGFPSGTDLPNNTEILIKDAFFSFFVKNDGTNVHKIIITSYDVVNQAVGDIDIPTDNIISGDTDLPF